MAALDKYIAVKEVRMVKDRLSGFNRDFCFVEVFNSDDVERAIQMAKEEKIRILGQAVFLTWGKSKAGTDMPQPFRNAQWRC